MCSKIRQCSKKYSRKIERACVNSMTQAEQQQGSSFELSYKRVGLRVFFSGKKYFPLFAATFKVQVQFSAKQS